MLKKLILSAVFAVSVCAAVAQPQMQPLPMDPAVRMGTLPNGLTYYIRHNELPEHHAEFFIAQKVGSILEEENQRGLAHFLEHMAFNGLKNFPGKSMLEYLQSHGVKFGTNVNAYTSFDETVYNISDVPIDENLHPGIVDSCLLVLHDWSGYISLEDEEIDNERGVIHEEWRSRNSGPRLTLQDSIIPVLLPNRYAYRMPIGLMSVVDSFEYQTIRDYYNKWYRPDLQGIFIVGDVDVDAVEKKIAELWKDIETPADAAERIQVEVEDNKEPLVAVAANEEQTYNIFALYFKRDKMPDQLRLTQMGYIQDLLQSFIENAVQERINEVAQKPGCPFLQAGFGFGSYIYANTKDAAQVQIVYHDGKLKEAMQQVMDVVRSVAQYGLTEAEIERIKAETLSNIEKAYNDRAKVKNRQHVAEIQRHFLDYEPMPGIEFEWNMAQQLMPYVNAQFINQFCSSIVSEENVAMYILGRKAEGIVLPTPAELLATYKEVCSSEVKPLEEEAVASNLIEKMPKIGKIKKVAEGPFGSTVWTLSNGAQVIWKKTDFKLEDVNFVAYSNGGTDAVAGLTRGETNMFTSAYSVGGIGQFSPTQLQKALAGKQAGVRINVGNRSELVSGNSTPKDLRTLMQMIHLQFTQPRFDQELWDVALERTLTSLKNSEGQPSKIMSDSIDHFRYAGQPQIWDPTIADLENVDYKQLYTLGKQRFANAADFTFYFIGNIDEDSLRLFTQQYIASLPAKGKKEAKGKAIVATPGSREMRFNLPMQAPKTRVYNFYEKEYAKNDLRQSILASMLGQCVSIVYTAEIREKEGGTYSPSVQGQYSMNTGHAMLVYLFETGEEKREHLEMVAERELRKLATEGIPAETFQKVRDYMVKRHQENLKENSYWLSAIRSQVEENTNVVDSYDEIFNSITVADVQHLLVELMNEGDHQVFVCTGVEK